MRLAVAHGIIKEHGGDIRVYSELGKGTIFHVYLYLMENLEKPDSKERSGNHPTGMERILLVDDEESIIELESQVLERLGYTITAYTRCQDALNAFKNDPDGFDLVITDMAMPKMTGEQFAKALFSIRRDIPVIICTGFSERIDHRKVEELGISGLLNKPILKSDMASKVRKVLDEHKN